MSDSDGTMTWIVVDNESKNEFMDFPEHEGYSNEEVVNMILKETGWDREDCKVTEEERPRDWMMS